MEPLSDEVNFLQISRHLTRSSASSESGKNTPELSKPFLFMNHIVRRSGNDKDHVSMLQSNIVVEPPSSHPQVLREPKRLSFSQYKQDFLLRPILDQLSPGFFVESGALNGETDSNSLFYERQKGWTGLLVEPSPREYPILKAKQRHAYTFNGCLSPSGHEELLHFDPEVEGFEGIAHIATYSMGSVPVRAAPLEALLKEIGRTTVDFWSLDIEGSEASVLNSTNFSNVEVGVMLVEMNKNDANDAGVFEVMEREGFLQIGHSNYFDGGTGGTSRILDRIFVNPDYFERRNLAIPAPEDLPVPNQDVITTTLFATLIRSPLLLISTCAFLLLAIMIICRCVGPCKPHK